MSGTDVSAADFRDRADALGASNGQDRTVPRPARNRTAGWGKGGAMLPALLVRSVDAGYAVRVAPSTSPHDHALQKTIDQEPGARTMDAAQAKQTAREWIDSSLRQWPGVRGAHLVG